jgi:hypothetical protein
MVDQAIANTLERIDRRGEVDEEAARIELCDGTDPAAVKAYLRCLQIVPERLRADVVHRTARGPLLRETALWLQDNQFGLAEYRNHILQTFVAHEVDGIAKAELQQISRQPGETILSYNRRFREAAAEAYPGARNQEQTETLVRMYAAGLRDSTKAAKIVQPAWPETIEEGMARVANAEVQASNLQRLGIGRNEEPMEIDASSINPAGRATQSNAEKELHHLKTQYGKLEAKLDRLLERQWSSSSYSPAQQSTRNHPSERPQETRTCFECGQRGHIRRHCPQRPPRGGQRRSAAAAAASQ